MKELLLLTSHGTVCQCDRAVYWQCGSRFALHTSRRSPSGCCLLLPSMGP